MVIRSCVNTQLMVTSIFLLWNLKLSIVNSVSCGSTVNMTWKRGERLGLTCWRCFSFSPMFWYISSTPFNFIMGGFRVFLQCTSHEVLHTRPNCHMLRVQASTGAYLQQLWELIVDNHEVQRSTKHPMALGFRFWFGPLPGQGDDGFLVQRLGDYKGRAQHCTVKE